MASPWSAEMILFSGSTSTPVEKAIGTVKDVLCRPKGTSRDVYAVIIRAKRPSPQPDHLSMMYAVISAARKGWHEASRARKTTTIEVVERNGIRIYRGCASPAQFEKNFVREEGIYIFPSHLKPHTLENLGLAPLSAAVTALPIVLRVEIESKEAQRVLPHEIDRESFAWRDNFISQYKGLSAAQVADESGNTAKNRSAIASRWMSEKKIFGVRFQNKTLYPAFQFKDGEPVPAIAEILKEMPAAFTGWDFAFFLTSPNGYLDGKLPLELLKSNPDRVVSLAHAFAHSADAY